MYVSSLYRPVSGLTQALALNAAELDTRQAHLQARALKQDLVPGPRPNASALPAAPLAYEPQPEAAAWQRNLAGFLRQFHAPVRSLNPYNDHRFFAAAPVLRCGWADAPTPASVGLAAGRADLGPANRSLVHRFRLLLELSGFDKRFPVLLDGQGRVLDGWHRLLACAESGQRFYFLQLNF